MCYPLWILGVPTTKQALSYNPSPLIILLYYLLQQLITTSISRVSFDYHHHLYSYCSVFNVWCFFCVLGDGFYPHMTHCPLYDPVGATTSSAWKDLGLCTSTVSSITTAIAPSLPAWSGVGCPDEWTADTVYKPGQVAALNGVVYMCSTEE